MQKHWSVSQREQHEYADNKRLYHIWGNIKQRCLNPQNMSYARYGGRGITVCPEWIKSYNAFQEWAIANGYSETLTIDRIDPSKGYEPSNCRWIPASEQSANRRMFIIIEYQGEAKTLTQWCKDLGLNYSRIKSRIQKSHCSFEQAINADKYSINTNRLTRKVGQFDAHTGEQIAVYNSIKEAAAATGTRYSNLCGCCKNERKTAGGFSWKYLP